MAALLTLLLTALVAAVYSVAGSWAVRRQRVADEARPGYSPNDAPLAGRNRHLTHL